MLKPSLWPQRPLYPPPTFQLHLMAELLKIVPVVMLASPSSSGASFLGQTPQASSAVGLIVTVTMTTVAQSLRLRFSPSPGWLVSSFGNRSLAAP